VTINHLIVISIIGWGTGSFFYKGANTHLHPMMVATIATCVYLLTIPIYFLFFKFDHQVNAPGVIYTILGGACMCLGSMAYFYAIRTGTVGQITALTALHPTLTMLLSCLFMGENFTYQKALGIILALGSAYFLSL